MPSCMSVILKRTYCQANATDTTTGVAQQIPLAMVVIARVLVVWIGFLAQ